MLLAYGSSSTLQCNFYRFTRVIYPWNNNIVLRARHLKLNGEETTFVN